MATTTTPTTGKRSATPSERIRLRRPLRSFDLHEHLTILFVCGIATVIFTRGLLAATGYPQVGNSSLHIAHVLWGGLLMLSALLALLAFLSPATRPVSAVLGGVGFGLFIDEVGKFVTKDVDYFYKPAIAIIYVAFVVMFGVIRWLSRRGFTAQEATLIALETLQRSAVGALSEERRAEVLHLMQTTGADDPLALDVRKLLETCDTVPDTTPIGQRISKKLAAVWVPLTRHPLFRLFIDALLVVGAAISTAEGAWLLRHGIHHTSFSERAFCLTTIAADVLLLIGAIRLSRSILSSLRWYDHAVLLEIVVGQVFLYGSEQLAATLNLVALLIVWALIRWAIHYEQGAALRPPLVSSASP
ncbi:MAG: hypothetical protein JOY72_09750 [Actinobacteria bacterium]|nr:hypothetical protein [Actinomycetota bacterium]